MNIENLYNKSVSCFLGQMIGDSLGARYEFYNKNITNQIKNDSINGFLPILGGGVWNVDPGQVTDDTEMAFALIESIKICKTIDSKYILNQYINWHKSKPFDEGYNTKFIFGNDNNRSVDFSKKLAINYDIISQNKHGSPNLSNGCLMRISPIGILLAPIIKIGFTKLEIDQLISIILNITKMDTPLTHSSNTAIIASAVYASLIGGNIAFGRKYFCNTLKLIKTIGSYDPIVDQIVKKSINFSKLDPPATVKIGYLGTGLQLAILNSIYVSQHNKSFYSAILDTIKLGGDTDTNAAIVGSSIGSLVEINEIPINWIKTVTNYNNKNFLQERLEKFKPYKTFKWNDLKLLIQIGYNIIAKY